MSQIIVDRRLFLASGTMGLLVSTMSGRPSEEGTFSTMMAALEPLGDELPLTTAAEQNAYVYRLAAEAMRVRDYPTPRMGAMGRTGVEIGPLARTEPPTDMVHGVALVSYRMAPGAVLQAHNHPNYSVATIGISGEARVTHYEPDRAPPMSSREPFVVRRTAERLLRQGEASTLVPSRDNIHTFTAGPQGAQFVDLFSVHGDNIGFSYLEIAEQPRIVGSDTFAARWIGDRPSNA